MNEKDLRELGTKLLKIQVSSKNDSTKLIAHVLVLALDYFFEESLEDITATKAIISVTRSSDIKAKFYDHNNVEHTQILSSLYKCSLNDEAVAQSFSELKTKLSDFKSHITFNNQNFKISIE